MKKKLGVIVAASLFATLAFAQASAPAAPAVAATAAPKASKHKKTTHKKPCTLDQSKVGDCTLQ
ncbi:invasion protein IalB [Paraburkholderia sp. UCT70]|uniref:hypothetical protein n=1 Tax=Paraburkholderia sp. UCT70 TaxID=2991068 RepID=UPI003D21EBF4